MISLYLRLVLVVLAVYRLSELFSLDQGPLDMFGRLRGFFGRMASESKRSDSLAGEVALLLSCPFCLGIWLSVAGAFLMAFPSRSGDFILLILGIAGAQCFMEQQSRKRSSD